MAYIKAAPSPFSKVRQSYRRNRLWFKGKVSWEFTFKSADFVAADADKCI